MSERCLLMSENVFECHKKVCISRKTSSDICKTSEMSVFVRNVVFYLTGLFKRTKIRLFRY